jgi:hypothetical protein
VARRAGSDFPARRSVNQVFAHLKEFLNTDEVSALIGRSPGGVRNLVLRRLIPFRKPGGRLMFLHREILAWIESTPGLRLDELR